MTGRDGATKQAYFLVFPVCIYNIPLSEYSCKGIFKFSLYDNFKKRA